MSYDVHIEHLPVLDKVNIYVLSDRGSEYLDSDQVWTQFGEGTMPDPLLSLRADVYRAIAQEIQLEPLPRGTQSVLADALKDAREVRDRLLAMLEVRGHSVNR